MEQEKKQNYMPQLGHKLVYPISLEGGSAQVGRGPLDWIPIKYGDWLQMRAISALQAQAICLLAGAPMPDNKYGVVVETSYRGAVAVYNHDGRYYLIRYSSTNVLRLTAGRATEHTQILADGEHGTVWSWDSPEAAAQAASYAFGIWGAGGSPAETLNPTAAPPRWKTTASPERVYVPMLRLTMPDGESVVGQLALNGCHEPIGVWTGTRLVRAQTL